MTGVADHPGDGVTGPAELAIGIDVGGTKIAGGVVDPAGRVLTLVRAETPADDVGRTREAIIDMVRRLAAGHRVTGVGIGSAGWVDATRDRIRFAPHLAWRDEPLREHVADAVGLPVVVENDANAAAWAEFRFGAGRQCQGSMVMLTVGTGLGGGFVLDGRLLRGGHGFAAEPGHVQAVPGGEPCRCGRQGCLEMYVSGRALVRYARQGAAATPEAAGELLRLAGGVERITGVQVTAAARAGDPVARAAFGELGRWLGAALADLVQLVDPELLVIGGGVVEAGELLLAPVREAYQRALGQRGRLPAAPVQPARLGNLAGVVGAADLARGSKVG